MGPFFDPDFSMEFYLVVNVVEEVSEDIKHSVLIRDYGFKHFNVISTDSIQEKSFYLIVSEKKSFLIFTFSYFIYRLCFYLA